MSDRAAGVVLTIAFLVLVIGIIIAPTVAAIVRDAN